MATASNKGLAMHRLLPALLGALLLAGCSYIPWVSREEDPRPPTELTDITPRLGVSELWSSEIGEGTDERRLSLVPALQGGRLFVADAEGLVTSLNAADGRVLWQRETGLPFSGGPEVSGQRLLLGSTDGDLVALSTTDGSELWRSRVNSEILSVPRMAGETVVLHTLDDDVLGFDGATGERLWTHSSRAPVLTLRGSSTPVVAGDYAVVGVSGGKLVKLEVASGLPEWETTITPPRGRSELERIADVDATPVLEGNTLYACAYNGDLAAVDLASGSVLWRRELSAHAGLAAADGVLYVTDSDDQVWAAQPSDGAGIWKQEALRFRDLSAPAVYGDWLVVGDLEGYLHWLSRRDGEIVARLEVADGPIRTRPLVSGGRLFVYGEDGTVAALSAGGAPRR
jgi:outer membrane protein assembly factor BamB